MNEETTTSTQVDDSTASATTEQAEEQQEQAVQGVEETSETTSEESEETTETQTDDELKAWAEKKGLEYNPDNPAEVKLAKMVREGDKKVTETTQKASNLGKSVQTASEETGLDEVTQLRNEVAVINFYQAHPDARELDADMAKVLEEKPYLASDLDALYFYTKGMQTDKDIVAARQAGSKEALAAAAQAERAGAPKASATARTTAAKALTNEDIKNMSIEEYQAAKDAGQIQPFLQ